MNSPHAKGFTLIELLVVIAIVGVLATVTLLAVNPAEMLRKARDSSRLQELTILRKAIDSVIATKTASILDTIATSNSCTFADPCNSTSGSRNANGTGWLPIAMVEYIPVLPIDPRDNTPNTRIATGDQVTPKMYFATDGSSYKVASFLESAYNVTLLTNDGGTESVLYEVGTGVATAMTLN